MDYYLHSSSLKLFIIQVSQVSNLRFLVDKIEQNG